MLSTGVRSRLSAYSRGQTRTFETRENTDVVVADDERTGRMGLSMRRDKRRPVLTRIWVKRIGKETSYPDWLDLELVDPAVSR